MPNGKTHRQITKYLLLGSLPLFTILDPLTASGVVLGIGTTLLINPDNDIAVNRLGIYKWLGFDKYNRIIKHRAGLRWNNWREFEWWKLFLFSHFPVTGTFLRFLIFLYPVIIILLIFSAANLWMFRVIFGIFIGMCFSDTIHILCDLLIKEKRNEKRSKNNRVLSKSNLI